MFSEFYMELIYMQTSLHVIIIIIIIIIIITKFA